MSDLLTANWKKGRSEPRLGLLNRSGLEPAPSGECTASLPAGGSLEEASESAPSRSALHWSSYIRNDGIVSCFLCGNDNNKSFRGRDGDNIFI